jgi:putative DNA methylase
MSCRKKLIEVALPLAEINDASAYDKMPGIGPHPKGIHHWWARLPLPTARAVLFASVVDDPSSHPDRFPTDDAQNAERERLFGLLRQLMQKRMHEHPEVYAEARAEMLRHADGRLPPLLDPFAGGGSIPLEAARLGFEVHAADLNPIAVLLNKCTLELIPRWLGQPPVNPEARKGMFGKDGGAGARGLAEDVRYYGRIIYERAARKIGHLYPRVKLPKAHGGREADVIAWLWARTVKCPNPACGAQMPLVRSFWLATKAGKKAWVEPVVDKRAKTVRFRVGGGDGSPPDGTVKNRAARCLVCGESTGLDYVRAEAQDGRMAVAPLIVVATGARGRVFVPFPDEHARIARSAEPEWKPEELVTTPCHDVDRLPMYGMYSWGDAFTPRQLTTMVTLSGSVEAIREDVLADAVRCGLPKATAEDYANFVVTCLALAVDRCSDFNNSLCRWTSGNQKVMNLFGKQAIPMVWDFAEANILGSSVGAWSTCSDYVADCIEVIGQSAGKKGNARQLDAASYPGDVRDALVSTDPPYYDNIGYAALSDFFYVWLRRTIGDLYPDLFSTILVPKGPELTAAPERFSGDREKARQHFELGFRKAFTALREKMDPRFPLAVYYAFKQQDEDTDEDESGSRAANGGERTTGWETLLQALLGSGFQITATWPVRASQRWRMVAMGTNALASYIVLACRPKEASAPLATRREFVTALRRELPDALLTMMEANIAPVDLAQASIGPGMAVFSRYAKVLEADGSPMSVRTALQIINQELDAHLTAQEGELDNDTRFCVSWFEQYGMGEGPFGEADVLARARNTAVNGLADAGVADSRAGKVRLLKRAELPDDWDPIRDQRLTT